MRHETLDTDTAIAIPAPMTRREKLLRWAGLIRAAGFGMTLIHGLEHYSPDQLAVAIVTSNHASAFGVALLDPVFQDAGLPRSGQSSVADQMKFFELSQQQLHEFACYCGGAISNEEMAQRIERIAAGT